MATPQTLRFRARGTACVPNLELQEQAIRACVGRKMIESEPGKFGFAPTGEAEEVPYRSEYVKACAEGDLYPADEATLAACATYAKAHGLSAPETDPAANAPKASASATKTTTKPADTAEQKG